MSRKSSSHTQPAPGSTDLQKTLEQGNQLLQNKKYKKAVTLCERYLAGMPDNPYILSLAGIAADLNNQSHVAVDYFRRAVACAPNEATLYYNLGKSLKQSGNIAEAINTYQQALNLAPDNPAVLLNLGNLYLGEENGAAAIPLFQKLLDNNPGHVQAWRGLGVARRLDGQLDAARDCFLKAHELAPTDSHVLVDLGDIHYRLGKTAEAESYSRKAIAISPNEAATHSNLGVILNELNRTSEAIAAYRSALDNDPHYIPALKNLGAILITEKPEEAEELFQRAGRLAPEDADIIAGQAHTSYQLGDIDRAESLYRQILEQEPDHVQAHYGIGICENARGNRNEAIECFRKTIQLDPEHAAAHLQLAASIKHNKYDEDMINMESLLEDSTLTKTQKYKLHFGLGKAYEDLQDYDKAFTHYADANTLKRSTIEYYIATDRQRTEDLIQTFDDALFRQFEGCGYPDNNPIFIVGMPRSGTTLTEQILSSHPDVFGAGEMKNFGNLIEDHFNEQLHAPYPENMQQFDYQMAEKLGRQYCDSILDLDRDALHITNKMPYNFFYIGMIRLLLPNAKIIHCNRNPLDTCISCYSKNFVSGNGYTYSLEELGQFYNLYFRLMQHWRQLDAIDIIEISYEELINDQEQQTRRLLAACGLEWNDACLNFHKSDRPVMTASVTQVRDKIYNKSVHRWKHFEAHLTPLINTLKKEIPSALLDI